MTIKILDERTRTIRVQADTLDENFDFSRDRSHIYLNDRFSIVQAWAARFDESIPGEFDVEAQLSKAQFAQLKSMIHSL